LAEGYAGSHQFAYDRCSSTVLNVWLCFLRRGYDCAILAEPYRPECFLREDAQSVTWGCTRFPTSVMCNALLAAKCCWCSSPSSIFWLAIIFDAAVPPILSHRVGRLTAMDRLSGQRDFRIQRAVQFLNEDPFRTLPELADNCKISSSRLSHLFKSDIGVNLKHYPLDCRLEMAAEMLLWTHRPVKEIAYAVGYRHCSSFVRAFGTRFGFSPTCYRNNQPRRAA